MPPRVTYLDNAATSWPKPPPVAAAMKRFLDEVGANPGRSGHRLSIEAARVVYRAREAVAGLLGVADPMRVIFCANATHALNLAPTAVKQAVRPETTLIVMPQASNVVGTLMPVREIAEIARAHELLHLVDGAQSVGALPIDMNELGADLLVFIGHKALCGPTGTGGLIIGERVDIALLDPLMRGGTGSNSESELQPDFLPDKFESGTMNVVGLAGLDAGLHWLAEQGPEALRSRERTLAACLIEGLGEILGVEVRGTRDASRQLPVVSFTLTGLDPAEIGLRLDEEFGVAARVGLHCSPIAHLTLGTFPTGAVQLSLGALSTRDDVDVAVRAVGRLAEETRRRGGAG